MAAAHASGQLSATVGPRYRTSRPPGISHDVPGAFAAGALIGVATDWFQRVCPRNLAEIPILTKPLLRALAVTTSAPSAP